MKILFIYSVENYVAARNLLNQQEDMQFGISYISSLLKRNRHATRLVVLNSLLGRKNFKVVSSYIRQFKPELVCFTAVATQFNFISSLAQFIKARYPNIYLLSGGPHISLNPYESLRGAFDSICIGEGEYPTIELVSQLESGRKPSGIFNLWIKHDRELEKNPTRQFLQQVDELPFPDREMWQEWMFEKLPQKCSVLIGRGCSFDCSYCCNHALRKLAQGNYIRHRSSQNIVDEIKEITDTFPTMKEIYLEVEDIATQADWAASLCDALTCFNAKLKTPLSFGANIRVVPGADLHSLFKAFKKSNFRFVNIGLESGSERVRKEILRRYYSNQDIINTVALAREYGLKVALYNMVGIPGETRTDFQETIRINRLCRPDWHITYLFYPYPGTDLYSRCKELGLLSKPLGLCGERRKAFLDLPGFSRREIQKSYIWFNYNVYQGYKPEYELLRDIIRLRRESSRLADFVYSFYSVCYRSYLLKGVIDYCKKYFMKIYSRTGCKSKLIENHT